MLAKVFSHWLPILPLLCQSEVSVDVLILKIFEHHVEVI